MTIGIFRDLVLARAIAVEPIARALCTGPIDTNTTPFPQMGDRRRPAHGFNSPSRDGAHISNQEETVT